MRVLSVSRYVVLSLLLALLVSTCGSPSAVKAPEERSTASVLTAFPTLPLDPLWGIKLTVAPSHQRFEARLATQSLDPATVDRLLTESALAVRERSRATTTLPPRQQRALAPLDLSLQGSIDSTLTNPTNAPQLVHVGPTGKTNGLDTFVSLLFDRPAVAAELVGAVAGNSPFRLLPEAPGGWRWVTPKLLTFQAQSHLPQATRFNVEYVGQGPAVDPSWSAPHQFETAELQVVQWFPPEGAQEVSASATVFIGFNQRIKPKAVLPFVRRVAPASRRKAERRGGVKYHPASKVH